MGTHKVLALVGGISNGSINRKLFLTLKELSQGITLETFDIARLPYFSQDIENDPPDVVTEFKERIREAEAILFVTPEYNRSIPGVLKNAIDWGTRPYGQNLWKELPAAVIGITPGGVGTSGAQNHLRQVLMAVGLYALPQPELYLTWSRLFNEQGKLKDEKGKNLLQGFLGAFRDWIDRTGPSAVILQRSQGLEDSPEFHH